MSVERQRVYDYRRQRHHRRDYAVLVDGMWPRGISKRELSGVKWLRELAPSSELRRWFGHKESRWKEFKQCYKQELDGKQDELDRLRRIARRKRLLLLYGARDTEHNQAVVLESLIRNR